VLEEMGKPGPARALVFRANVVPDVHRDHGDVMILVDDDIQPVGQRAFAIGELDAGH